jgi:hypothetical protein
MTNSLPVRQASGQNQIKNNQVKKTFVYPAALSLLFLFVISCTKEQLGRSIRSEQPNRSIEASVATGETFTFVAGTTGSLTVSKQALHFQVSQALNENGSIYYNYQPKAGYFGADEVTLMYLSGAAAPGISSSTGCPASHDNPASSNAMSTIVIKLNVTK